MTNQQDEPIIFMQAVKDINTIDKEACIIGNEGKPYWAKYRKDLKPWPYVKRLFMDKPVDARVEITHNRHNKRIYTILEFMTPVDELPIQDKAQGVLVHV